MAKLILMCGIPGSGKSTLAKKLFGERDIYVSRDEIRFSMISDEDEYFSKETEVFNEFVRQIQAGIDNKEKRYVIADATHLNTSSRMKLINRLTFDFEPDISMIFVNTPLEIALERNKQRSGRAVVPDKVIKNMYHSFAAPSKIEPIKEMFIADENGFINKKYERKGGE